ncbi:hypothetical protein B0T25DRAFT_627967 [Lasiosphaeria hispida]|uniref:Uncharacterized protein n=1 Tax=Lasiosphaeria hispida TaxID=260671 RepID=A0AAJ0MKT2_9PEZI|nr:hypothetical protein B0T25DRAFT_627967 [Lasiosphaeria hispida]
MSSDVATKAFVQSEIVATKAFVKSEIASASASLGAEIASVKSEVASVKSDLASFKAETKVEFRDVKATISEMQVTMRQFDARARNGKLKNPTARIRAVPIFIQGHGAKDPDPSFFPQYADQLYSLRKPQMARDYQILTDLSKFYDIWNEAANTSQSGEEEDKIDPERAVELLEEILGLEEERFTAFRAKAQQLTDQGPPAGEKRDRLVTSLSGGPQPTAAQGSPTVPFSQTPSRAPPRAQFTSDGTPTVPSGGSPTVPFTETPTRVNPERLLTILTPPRPRSTIPDSEAETASS